MREMHLANCEAYGASADKWTSNQQYLCFTCQNRSDKKNTQPRSWRVEHIDLATLQDPIHHSGATAAAHIMEHAPTTEDIPPRGQRSWWNTLGIQRQSQRDSVRSRDQSIFGARLQDTLKYSSVAISLADKNGDPYIWGYVPVIVAKIGLFLKHHGA